MKALMTTLCLAGGLTTALAAPASALGEKAAAGTEAKIVAVSGCLHGVSDQSDIVVLVGMGEGAAKTPRYYRVVGSASADPKAHIGQEVRISGALAKPPAGGAAPPAKLPASLTAADVKDMPELTAQSVEKVSDTCSPPSQ